MNTWKLTRRKVKTTDRKGRTDTYIEERFTPGSVTPTDEYYANWLRGKATPDGIVCRFTLPDGTVIDGPCKLIDGALLKLRGNDPPVQEGFGL